MLLANTENILDKVIMERKKKAQTINSKKTEYIVSKRNSPKYELRIDVKIKQYRNVTIWEVL